MGITTSSGDLPVGCAHCDAKDAALAAKAREVEALRGLAEWVSNGPATANERDILEWATRATVIARAALAGDGAGEATGRHDGNCGGPVNCTVCAIGDSAPESFEVYEDPPVACGTFQNLPEVPCKCSASPTGKNRGWRVHLAAACYPTTGEWRAAEAEARRKSVGG